MNERRENVRVVLAAAILALAVWWGAVTGYSGSP